MPRWEKFGAAEEVAAADDDADLDVLDRGGDFAGDRSHDIRVDADPTAAEDLTGEFEQDAPAMGADGMADVSRFVNRGACHGVLLPCGQIDARVDRHSVESSGPV